MGHALHIDVGEEKVPTFHYGVVAKYLGAAIGDDTVPMVVNVGLAYNLYMGNVVTFAADLEPGSSSISTRVLRACDSGLNTQLSLTNPLLFLSVVEPKLRATRRAFLVGLEVNIGGPAGGLCYPRWHGE